MDRTANRELSAREFAHLIREDWWCENKNHYAKDTAFNEDGTTKRVGAFNFSVLISIFLNIMRINKIHNIRGDIYLNTMEFNKMMSIINYLQAIALAYYDFPLDNDPLTQRY